MNEQGIEGTQTLGTKQNARVCFKDGNMAIQWQYGSLTIVAAKGPTNRIARVEELLWVYVAQEGNGRMDKY